MLRSISHAVVLGFGFLTLTALNVRAETPPSNTIEIGNSLDTAIETFRRHRVEFVEGGLATTKLPDDTSYLLCLVNPEQTSIVLNFSKSKRTITGIGIIHFPRRQHSRTEEITLSAKSVTLAADGSYSITYLPTGPTSLRPGASNKIP